MENEIELEEFYVIGLSVRTTNQDSQSQRDIAVLFGNFWANAVLDKIPNKINDDIYCVYTDYEGDFNAPYTTVVGCRVENLDNIPAGLIGRTIPASKYLVFKSKGRFPDCLKQTWTEIWQSDIERKYAADFDVHGEKAQNLSDAEVETFVSIK